MQVEKNVPIPKRKRKSQFDFIADMEVGDSFVVGTMTKVCQVRTWARKNNIPVLVRKIEPGEFRIWRV